MNDFQSIIDALADVVFVHHPVTGKIEYINNTCEHFYGYSAEEIIEKGLELVVVNKKKFDVNKQLELIEKAAKGEILTFDWYTKKASGKAFWVEVVLKRAIVNNDLKVVATVRDITQRKDAIKAFRERELLLDSINQNISDGIYRTIHGGKFVYVNEAFVKMFGYDSVQEVLSVQPSELYIDSESRNKFADRIISERGIKNFISEFKRKDGSTFWGSMSSNFTDYKDGNAVFDGVVKDITEQREAQKKIGESQLMLESINQNINEGLYRSYTKGGLIYVNDAFAKMFGYENAEEILQVKSLDLYAKPKDRKGLTKTVLEQGFRSNIETEFKRKDGSTFWGSNSYVLARDTNGQSIFDGAVRDITEQRESQQKIEESQRILESINQNISEGIYRSYEKGGLIYVNEAFAKMFGYSSVEEILNVNSINLYGKSNSRKILTKKVARQGSRANVETEFKRKDGSTFWGMNSALLTKDNEGNNVFDGAIRDITKERESNRKIEESQRILESINRNISEGLYRSYSKGGLIYTNDAFANMFGYKNAEEILKVKSLSLYDRPKDRKGVTPSVIKTGYRSNIELKFKRKDGSTFWGLNSFILTKDHEGNDIFDGAVRDISKEKKAAEELSAINEELLEKNFELDQLVYKTSHDLRSPLRSVLGLTNLMKLENPEIKNEYFDRIDDRIHKMDDFIKSMLNYSRANRLDLKKESINFQELIAAAVDDLEYLEGFSNFKILETYSGVLDKVKVDKLRLSIIFSNLISNAFKYRNVISKESYLKISVSYKYRLLKITFEDNGIGIAKKYINSVFDMFFRATEKSDGSGLGMYIVKQAVDKLDGTVTIESKLKVGTKIEVKIPS